jgi:SAP domain
MSESMSSIDVDDLYPAYCFNCLNPLHPGPCKGSKKQKTEQKTLKKPVEIKPSTSSVLGDLKKLTIPQLKVLAKQYKEKVGGNKQALIDRITTAAKKLVTPTKSSSPQKVKDVAPTPPSLLKQISTTGSTFKKSGLVSKELKKALGRDLTDQELHDLTNAIPGSQVEIYKPNSKFYKTEEGKVDFFLKSRLPDARGKSDRVLTIDTKNKLITINNQNFNFKKDMTKDDLTGADLFYKQVDTVSKLSKELGFKTDIKTFAAGYATDPKYVGYKVWPKLGYDGPLNDNNLTKLKKTDPSLHKKYLEKVGGNSTNEQKTLQKLLEIPGGTEYWEKHGRELFLTFDPTPGSPHRKQLENYLINRTKGK